MTNEPIAVSVAVITYNMQQYLPQLLDSILMQRVNFRCGTLKRKLTK